MDKVFFQTYTQRTQHSNVHKNKHHAEGRKGRN